MTIPAHILTAGSATQPAVTQTQLQSLSDIELFGTYERTAVAVGITDAPLALNFASYDPTLRLIKGEIVRRGAAMLPPVIGGLRAELRLQRPARPGSTVPAGLVADELDLLQTMNQPASVIPLLGMLETCKANKGIDDHRQKLLAAIEALTYTSFLRTRLPLARAHYAVEHPDALPMDSAREADYPAILQRYRNWLAHEGQDPSTWLSLAQKRARKLLERPDSDAAYAGAVFLAPPRYFDGHPPKTRDDDPDHSVRRLGELLQASPRIGSGDHPYARAWVRLLASYGPRARPIAPAIIRLYGESAPNDWSLLADMWRIGGNEIMAHYMLILPTITEEVDKLQRDPATPKSFSSDDPRGHWFDSQRECRYGIDRWAGQVFDSDAGRIAWWRANQDRSPEQWLRDSLPQTVRRADEGHTASVRLLLDILPDIPHVEDEFGNRLARSILPANHPPYRQWLEAKQAAMRYDPASGTLRLPKP